MATAAAVVEPEILFSAFISYASQDKQKAFEICQSLEQRGFRCWIAPRDVRSGHPYPDEIIRGIEQSRCLILVLSDAANQSVIVAREVERAVGHRKAVFPVRIEEVLPSRGLELLVSTVHWIDAWTGNMNAHIERLARDLQDDDVIEKVAQFSQRAARRGRLPRWIAAVVAFLVLVAAVVTGNVIFNRARHRADPVLNAFRADMTLAGVDFGSVTKNEIHPCVSGTIILPRLEFRMDPKLSGMLLKYADFKFALGHGNFTTLSKIFAIRINVGGKVDEGDYAVDVKELMGIDSVATKFDLNYSATHQKGTVGPFTYPFNYQKELLEGVKQTALNLDHWATWTRGFRTTKTGLSLSGAGGFWHLNVLKDCYPAIKQVFVGAEPNKLQLYQAVPDLPRLDDKTAIVSTQARYDSAYLSEILPVPDNAPSIYVQLVFFDGSKSAVREQQRSN